MPPTIRGKKGKHSIIDILVISEIRSEVFVARVKTDMRDNIPRQLIKFSISGI